MVIEQPQFLMVKKLSDVEQPYFVRMTVDGYVVLKDGRVALLLPEGVEIKEVKGE